MVPEENRKVMRVKSGPLRTLGKREQRGLNTPALGDANRKVTELHRAHRSVSVSYKQGQPGIVGTNAETFKAEPGKQVRLCGQG